MEALSLKQLDTSFDFTMDCSYWNGFWETEMGHHAGCDPDVKSAMLRRYHQALWSKQLPCGEVLSLSFGKASDYLKYKDIRFGSDSIATSFRYKKTAALLREVMKVVDWRSFVEEHIHSTYTIGGIIIFPKHPNSMNGQRGMNPFICDRFDLTLECIRRYYDGVTDSQDNPLGWVCKADKNFFDLFQDFKGYVDFFFLQDCITPDYSGVKMWIPTEPFAEKHPFPRDVGEYLTWIDASHQFVRNRNARIERYIRNADVQESA